MSASGMPKAPSEGSLEGWDVLTDVPSEAGTHATILQERVCELEAEVQRLKLALAQQTTAVSDSVGTTGQQQSGSVAAPLEVGAAGTEEGWLLAEGAHDVGNSDDGSHAPAGALVCNAVPSYASHV